MRQRTHRIHQFITDHIAAHPQDIASFTAKHFGMTRQAVARHLQHLVREGVLDAKGMTQSREYYLQAISEETIELVVNAQLEEDIVWRNRVRPLLEGVSDNVLAVCSYGLTEMVNNVIDHSASPLARVKVFRTIGQIDLQVIDEGIGIFKKVADSCNLPDEREAILELAKGKLTTDPSRHTGEGIFFTSRMFDTFEIASGRLHFVHYQPDNDWLQQDDRGRAIKGTFIRMVISSRSTRHPRDVFGKYASSPEEATFSKTHVPISLAQFGTDSLVSRSQARRVLSRFDRFEEVFLDFSGVEFIGQAFADEIFRVYRNNHPNVRLVATHANDDVNGMIQHVTQNRQDAATKQGTDVYTETSTPLLPNEFIIDSTE